MTATSDHPQRRPQRTGNGNGKPRNAYQQHRPRIISRENADDEMAANEPTLIPQNEMAERALIGAALIDEQVLNTCSFVKPQYFFRHAHQVTWATLLDMKATGSSIDNITLTEALQTSGKMDDAGGMDAILGLGHGVPHAGHAKDYAKIVCEKYAARFTLRATADLAAAGYRGVVDEMASAWALQQAEIAEVFAALGVRMDGGEGPRFSLKSVREMRARPHPEWIIPGILQDRKRWLIFGDSNTGKSFLALDMALCLATGLPWHGRVVQPGAVVYVCAEGMDGITARMDAWLKYHRLEDAPGFHVIDEPPNLLDPAEVAEVIAQINASLDEPPIMIVFDTLAASMPGGDENSSETMGVALAAIRRVQRDCKCGVLVVHHSGKDSARGPRGHSSLRADFDTAFEVAMEEDRHIVSMRARKARDSEYAQDMAFRLKLITLADDGMVTSCVPEALDEPPSPDPRKVRRKPTASDKLYALMAQLPVGQRFSHGELRRRFMTETGLSGFSFDKAIDRLYADKRVTNVQGGYEVVRENTPTTS